MKRKRPFAAQTHNTESVPPRPTPLQSPIPTVQISIFVKSSPRIRTNRLSLWFVARSIVPFSTASRFRPRPVVTRSTITMKVFGSACSRGLISISFVYMCIFYAHLDERLPRKLPSRPSAVCQLWAAEVRKCVTWYAAPLGNCVLIL